ncbi:hypothetical protein DFP73DRAFT_565291 [Morchella snyderi]|nr:hypothetical protein DFP73DRAFT_565291 [Morchella snyderi]
MFMMDIGIRRGFCLSFLFCDVFLFVLSSFNADFFCFCFSTALSSFLCEYRTDCDLKWKQAVPPLIFLSFYNFFLTWCFV